MNIYVWRHNREFHSYSMINEPCVHQDFYRDAVAVVAARDREEALNILAARGGWRIDDLRQIEPAVYELREAALIFSDIR